MTSRSEQDAAPPSLMGNGDFRKLWAGETISVFGSQVTEFALPLTAILTLHATPSQVGILGTARYLPFLLVTVLAGVWVDRWRRRPVLLGTNLARAALIGLVPLAAITGRLSISLLCGIAFLVGSLTVLFDLAYLSYLPTLVPRGQLADGNGKLQASQSLAGVAGPGFAGVLVQILSAPVALLLDALSYLFSAGSLWRIQGREPVPEPRTNREPWRQEVAEGLRTVFGHPCLRSLAGQGATFNALENLILTVFMLYAIRVLGLGPGTLGLVLAAGSAGALLGALSGRRTADVIGLGPALIGSMTVACLSPLLFLLARDSGPGSLSLLTGAFFLHGAGVAVGNVNAVTLRQVITPGRLLGRMNASYRLLTYGAIPLGSLLGGSLASVVGLHTTLLLGATALPSALLWVVFSPVRSLPGLAAAAAIPAVPFLSTAKE